MLASPAMEQRSLRLPRTLALAVLAGGALDGCTSPADSDSSAGDASLDATPCPTGCLQLLSGDGAAVTYGDGAPYCLC